MTAIVWIARMVVILPALTVHEFAHAYVALRLGDPTAYSRGRCSLNPLRHLDPLGTICLMFSVIGWAKPVPVNPANFAHPSRDDMLVSAAGPVSNLLQAILAALALRLLGFLGLLGAGPASQVCIHLLFMAVWINTALAAFNALPIFPLDGFHVTRHFLPPRAKPAFEQTARFGMFAVLALVIGPRLLNIPSPLHIIIGVPVEFILVHVAGF